MSRIYQVKILLLFSLIATFTSQSLVDLADILLVVTAGYIAHQDNEIKKYFKGFSPSGLWPIWAVCILLGLVTNLGFFNTQVWLGFIEYRWVITLLSIIYLIKKNNPFEKLIKICGLFILILNLISIFLYLYRQDEVRAAGIINAVMAFSHNIAPLFSLFTVLAFVSWINFDRNQKILLTLVALTSMMLTLLSYTRGVWISSIAGILICLFVWNYKRALQFLILVILVGSSLVLENKSINDRIFSKTIAETSSNNARLALWRANWRIIQDYPLLGVGHEQNKYHLRKYYDELGYPADTLISHAHNQYLQVWAGTGTLGLICYLVFLFSIFKTAWRGYKNANPENKGLQLGLIAALLCFAIGALTEANFSISKNRFLFLLLAGLAIGFSSSSNKKPGLL